MSITVGEAYSEIIDKVIELLNAECVENGQLEGINRVIRGDKARGVIRPPVIWVYQESMSSTSMSFKKEEWILPLVLVVVHQNNDPEQGHIEATNLIDKVRSIIMKSNKLGGLPYIYDIKSGSFEPSHPMPANEKGLFGAGTTLNIHFHIFRD